MNLWLTIRVAGRALAKNKLRAGLTVLGIVIGVAAVITMVSMGQSAGLMVRSQFEGLGTNVVIVFPGSQRGGGVQRGAGTITTLVADDAQAMEEECPAVVAASPLVFASGQVIYGNSNWLPDQIVGVSPSYSLVRNWVVARGGFFTERDIHAAAKVCVIGNTIVARLFQTTDPIGRTVRIRNIPFQIIGVLEPKGANLVGEDQDNIVLVPYTTVQRRLSGTAFNNVAAVLASARTVDRMSDAEFEIRALLHERHHIRPEQPDDFVVRNSSEIARALGIVTGVMTMLLASIASVSLVVGGVGIMNIMLVSVTERTREIGIRLAVGARSRDILRQFLIEAVLLSMLGGLVGVCLGIGAAYAVTHVINSLTSGSRWPVAISPEAILAALGFSAGVGMFFGYYPARKASRLDPIDSLRYE